MDFLSSLTADEPTEPRTPDADATLRIRLMEAHARIKGLRRALLRRLVRDDDRIDVLGSQVLGYDLRPFHVDLLAFQSSRRMSLHLAPRGFGKSTVLNITRCIHEVIRDPNIRILIVSNTQLQAEVFLREVKYHLQHNPLLCEIFGHQVSDVKWDTKEILVAARTRHAKESTISCVGVGGPVVSRHYDLIIADDLVDEENTRTPLQREKVRDWYYRSLLPTLEPHGRLFVLGTRYHHEDLYGHLVAGEYSNRYKIVKALGDDGSTPWPSKFSREWLEDRRRSMGTLLFNSQYQNDIEALKGGIFKDAWLRYYEEAPSDLRIYQGVDLAISQRETADYFAMVTVGLDRHQNIYVLDAIQRRLSFRQQTNVIATKFEAYDPVQTAIETNAYQAAQLEEVRRLTNVRVKAVTTTKDKVTRFLKLAARFEAGQVFLRRGVMEDLVEQLLLAPEATHDDLLDALDFAVTVAFDRVPTGGLVKVRVIGG